MQRPKSPLKVHPFFKLGKNPAKRDKRNIKFAAILKKLPAVPLRWDFDSDIATTPMPTPMFLNDELGDCVIAGRAHMTLRFEYLEQRGKILSIDDVKDVLKEYKREGGSMVEGQQGLNMLDSLNWWRKKGWKADGKTYSIHAFSELDRDGIDEVKVAIRYLNGAYVGLSLPNSWQDQINRGQSWTVVPGPNGKPNPHNGHCVYLCGYTSGGPVCVNWGRKQTMTWEYLTAYSDEIYAIVDNRDRFVKNSPVDVNQLEAILKTI
jgi:hypothetical protein